MDDTLVRYSATVESPQYVFKKFRDSLFLNWLLLSIRLFDTICFKYAVCFAFVTVVVDDDQVRCREGQRLICWTET